MLPISNTVEQFNKLNLRDNSFVEIAKSLFIKQGGQVVSTGMPTNGSLPVVFINNSSVFKYFPPVFVEAWQTETKALKFLNSSRTVTPRLIGSGAVGDWKYLHMTKLPGTSLKDLWTKLSEEQRQATARQIGIELRKVHELPIDTAIFDLQTWDHFLSTQKHGCFARHERIGLRYDLLAQIPEFLNSVNLTPSRTSFLHTEIMRDHVFFNLHDHKLHFSGFIDFEPSRVGNPEYDFASVSVFLTSGDRSVLKAFFEGYGNLEVASTKDFRRRILAYLLLHQYSNLKWYLQFMPNADTLDELAELWLAV